MRIPHPRYRIFVFFEISESSTTRATARKLFLRALAHTLCRRLLCCVTSSVELINTSAGINKLLLTGKERMALRANFYLYFLFASRICGTCSYALTASASDSNFFVLRMDSLFHRSHLTFLFISILTYYTTTFVHCQEAQRIFLFCFTLCSHKFNDFLLQL